MIWKTGDLSEFSMLKRPYLELTQKGILKIERRFLSEKRLP